MAPTQLDEESDALARALAAVTGESVAGAVPHAIQERLARFRESAGAGLPASRVERARAIARRCAGRPARDNRTAEEILDYDDNGLSR